jgi:hypothetical protein
MVRDATGLLARCRIVGSVTQPTFICNLTVAHIPGFQTSVHSGKLFKLCLLAHRNTEFTTSVTKQVN